MQCVFYSQNDNVIALFHQLRAYDTVFVHFTAKPPNFVPKENLLLGCNTAQQVTVEVKMWWRDTVLVLVYLANITKVAQPAANGK